MFARDHPELGLRAEVLPDGFVVDTHVMRTSQMLKLTNFKTPKRLKRI